MSRRKSSSIKIELDIESLAPGGDGAGAYGERICFVKGSVPGERVAASVYMENKKALYARTEKVLRVSSSRTEPVCSHFAECGGCMW